MQMHSYTICLYLSFIQCSFRVHFMQYFIRPLIHIHVCAFIHTSHSQMQIVLILKCICLFRDANHVHNVWLSNKELCRSNDNFLIVLVLVAFFFFAASTLSTSLALLFYVQRFVSFLSLSHSVSRLFVVFLLLLLSI